VGCPNDETLLRMVERSLAPGRFGEIEVHLDACEHCRKAVAALALGSRSPSVPLVPFADLELPKNAVIHDRYEVGVELGHGGMGTVFLARDRTLGRNVALKLHRAGSGSDRLQREAIAMAKLAHPNVVNVFEVASYEDRMFVAMEYVKGGTLRSWLVEAPRTWREIVAMLGDAGRGLVAAHAAGLVHRDFKPENVLVGEDGRPRVGDFGLARTDYAPVLADPDALAVAMTVTGGLAGTPAYMAPEQLDGSMVDTRCDQFAFCVVAWEALYGQRPFTGLTISALHDSIVRHALGRPSSSVPDRVRKVIERGLATDPAARFPDMEALLVALRVAVAPQTTRNVLATALAAVVVAGGGYAIFTTITSRQRIATCERAADRAHAAFAPPARAVLEAGFIATGKPLARGAFARTASTLDRYTNALADEARSTCSDRDQVARVKLARETCIAQRRDELVAVVAALSAPDPANVARGPDAAWAVFDPSPCSDATVVSTQAHAPADFAKIAEIKADVETARYREGVAMATPFLAEARARKDQGLELDITMLLGELNEELDAKLGVSQYNDAEALAEAQGRDLDAASALDHLAGITGTDVHDHTLSHRQIALARAKLARIGGNAAIEARLDMTEAQVLVEEMKLADAEKSMNAAIATLEKVYGGEHPNVAQGYGVLSQILRAEGRLPDALVAARHTLAIANATLGEDHPTTAGAKMTLAQSLIDNGQLGEARVLLEQADASFEKVYGEIHPLRAAVQGNLCEIALVQQRYADALGNATLARDILAKAEGPDALAVAGPERDRSVALGALDRLDDASVAAKRALELIEKAGVDGEQRLPGALSDLCEVELAQDKSRDCLANAQRAVSLIEAKGKGADPLELGDARYLVARAMWEADKTKHAQALQVAAQAAEEHPLAERRKIIADWIAAHQK
jgi:tetratricopeptide (TPR) repeat protein/predicted Ser/Thr protein kinase